MAKALNLNYFDERNISSEHRVRHYRENITTVLQDQEGNRNEAALRSRWANVSAAEIVPAG